MAAPGFSETYGYDTLSRPTSTVTTIGSKSYTTTLGYHSSGSAIGQLRRIEYPTSTSGSTLLADYDYDSDGILYRVKDGDAPSTVWYELEETDALGQPHHGRFGNGLDQYLDYDDATHRLASIKSGPGTTPSLQNLRYEWDKLGNLEFRHDDRQGLTEAFLYDDLNRLDEVFLGSTSTLSLTYSLSGNVSYKSDVGTYTYSTHSKAVDQITGLRPATYLYDANGNRTRHNGDDVTWFSYNLPDRIDYGTDYAEFDYGPDRQRTKQVARTGSSTITTYYAGPHFEEESNGTATTFRHHILFGGQTVALVEKPTTGGTQTLYVHRDHLSAVDALTDGAQLVSQRLSFDAFGKRRNTDWTADTADSRFTDSHTTERGYTGHEHLDNVRMVHMNGRVLDPIIGRVISADPTVPDPYNGQAFNRMSYVYNNPLSFIDPSGFNPDDAGPGPGAFSGVSFGRISVNLGFYDSPNEGEDVLLFSLARQSQPTGCGICPIQGNPYWGAALYVVDSVTWGTLRYATFEPIRINTIGEANIEAFEQVIGWPGQLAGSLIGMRKGVLDKGVDILQSGVRKADVPNSTPRVRHHTDSAGADGITRDGAINPSRGQPQGVHVEREPFGPTRTASQETGAFGSGRYVEFDEPPGTIPNDVNIGPRNNGIIPTDTPLDITDLNPKVGRQ